MRVNLNIFGRPLHSLICPSLSFCQMGLLSQGTPMSWQEAKTHSDHVRKHGIQQFLAIYRKLKDRQNDSLLWGDEVRSYLQPYPSFADSISRSFFGLGVRSSTP